MIPAAHELKIYKKYADAILRGEKTFELRLDDRHYMQGDRIHFYEVLDGVTKIPIEHPITEKLYEITYIIYGNKFSIGGLNADWCVYSIKEVDNDNSET